MDVAIQWSQQAVSGTVWPTPTFTVFDAHRVHADTLDAAAILTQPSQVELYERAFARLSAEAVRGAAARALVTDALAALG
ncbi:Scr1 family TA system antitoxin-like transcriptional regulator [Streptomyces violascens]|uniref:Scr1 family TA system antitoxin-like transcriptional regulator n=1 Tax=Streptomyces violascens TaxID=67381 RepID=UPI003668102B